MNNIDDFIISFSKIRETSRYKLEGIEINRYDHIYAYLLYEGYDIRYKPSKNIITDVLDMEIYCCNDSCNEAIHIVSIEKSVYEDMGRYSTYMSNDIFFINKDKFGRKHFKAISHVCKDNDVNKISINSKEIDKILEGFKVERGTKKRI
jgi:hypothetical protein